MTSQQLVHEVSNVIEIRCWVFKYIFLLYSLLLIYISNILLDHTMKAAYMPLSWTAVTNFHSLFKWDIFESYVALNKSSRGFSDHSMWMTGHDLQNCWKTQACSNDCDMLFEGTVIFQAIIRCVPGVITKARYTDNQHLFYHLKLSKANHAMNCKVK